MPDIVSGVAVSGTHAYVADNYGGLRVVDVSDPTSPQEVGFYRAWDAVAKVGFSATPKMALNVAVAGGLAYVADEGQIGTGPMM